MNDRPDDPLDRPVRSVIRSIVGASPAPGAEPTDLSLTLTARGPRTRGLVLAAAAVMVVAGVVGTVAIANRSTERPAIQIDPEAASIELAEAQEVLDSRQTDTDGTNSSTSVPGDGTASDGIAGGSIDDNGAIGNTTRPPDQPGTGTPDDTTAITVILSNYSVFDVSVPREVQAGEALRIEWSVDAPTGVDITTARVGGASGWVSWCPFPMVGSRVSGTTALGRYRAGCTVPATAPNGRYTVLFLANTIGEAPSEPLGTAEVTFEVVGGSSDDSAPTVSAVSAPTTAQRGDSITFTWRSTDTSGVEYAIGWLANGGFALSDGTRVVDYGDFAVTRTSGDEFDGQYSQTVRFTDRSPLGTYTIWFSRLDSVGNKTIEESNIRITLTD